MATTRSFTARHWMDRPAKFLISIAGPAKDLLTFVSVPEAQPEQDRDLLRSRQKLLQQQTELRKHMQSLLRRNGLHYKAQTQNKTQPCYVPSWCFDSKITTNLTS